MYRAGLLWRGVGLSSRSPFRQNVQQLLLHTSIPLNFEAEKGDIETSSHKIRTPTEEELFEKGKLSGKRVEPVYWKDVVKKLQEDGDPDKLLRIRRMWDALVAEHQKSQARIDRKRWSWKYLEYELLDSPEKKIDETEVQSYLEEEKPEVFLMDAIDDEIDAVDRSGTDQSQINRLPVLPTPLPVRVSKEGVSVGVGKRKTASAKVLLRPGQGFISINGINIANYFTAQYHREAIVEPFLVSERLGYFDVDAAVEGGGISAQSDAVKLGIARALQARDPNYRYVLKGEGLLTRDPRAVERKKPGQKKARKKFQWSKR
tara:strand:- start:2665 stop:3615 length:951 start_codon:yes stop_codon:yes gene_type:complete